MEIPLKKIEVNGLSKSWMFEANLLARLPNFLETLSNLLIRISYDANS